MLWHRINLHFRTYSLWIGKNISDLIDERKLKERKQVSERWAF